MEKPRKTLIVVAAVICVALIAGLLAYTTIWLGSITERDTKNVARATGRFYLEQLARRREKIVENYLKERIEVINVAIGLMQDEDLSDVDHLKAYQAKMKKLFKLDKFAFVDDEGLIYTSLGTQTNIAAYQFKYDSLDKPKVSFFRQGDEESQVIIAVPIVPAKPAFQNKTLRVCFMAIKMENMLSSVGLSKVAKDENAANGENAVQETEDARGLNVIGRDTYCNIYTKSGKPLTKELLGGKATGAKNLFAAMAKARFDDASYSHERFEQDMQNGKEGVVSFTYEGVHAALAHIPVTNTDWQLTYFIADDALNDKIGEIIDDSMRRSMTLSGLTMLAMLAMFALIRRQVKKNDRLVAEREKVETESRVKQQELEQRLSLQEKLLAEQRRREEQGKLITALCSDYWSVYYLELDENRGTCYQAHGDLDGKGLRPGETFPYWATVSAYAEHFVAPQYREEFLRFAHPDNLRANLKDCRVISFTYLVNRHGKERYETARVAGVRHPEDRDDHLVHIVGACFMDSDDETRQAMEQRQALSDALATAQEASKAKTVFLSNMSHEIRTPMNAIIGLDRIALHDPALPPSTREYLEKIGTSADHLLTLINDILDISRIEAGRMTLRHEEFSFPALLQQINAIIGGQCRDKNLQYRCDVRQGLSDFYFGDNVKLKQVLINILGNAVKFTPEGGSVSMSVERSAHYEGKSTLRFVISDTGVGMERSFLSKLFAPFTQEDATFANKYGSTGLGMAITKSIVDIMNGRIDVESEKGKGTTFTVTLTLDDSKRTDAADFGELDPSALDVLIVDDDPIAAEHAQLVLEKVGVASDIAASGSEALEMVKMQNARQKPYDLILMDWKMPGMDGLEATRQIRGILSRESAVIILTSYNWDSIIEEALQAGVDRFVTKPLSASNVLDEFRQALQKVRESKGPRRAELQGRRVLLAEDIELNAEIMMDLLEMREVASEHAANGKVAVEMFSAHPEGYYDAILMDMRMPEMDGLEATRAIRALARSDAKTIPIIALTANAFDEDVQRSLQAGLNAHLSKPVEPELLYETLETYIK